MTRSLRAVLVVLGVSAAGAASVGALLWLDMTQGLDDRVAVAWQRAYEELANQAVARGGLSAESGLLAAFAATDVVLLLLVFAAAYLWGRSGLAGGPYAWLPVWLAPLWVASGMSGGLFKARAMAVLALGAGPADGLRYERAWRLVQPEAFGFLALATVAALLGWWAGRRRAARVETPPDAEDESMATLV